MTAWLRLARVSNLPTVASNTVAGVAVAAALANPVPVPLWAVLDAGFMVILGGALLYTGGMLLNDVCDARVDAVERPGRPIPAGRVTRRAAALVAAVCLLTGAAAFGVFREPRVWSGAAALLLLIVAYNLIHTRTAASVLLIAACRGLLSLTALMTVLPPAELRAAWLLPLALAAHTLALSAYARREVARDRAPRVGHLIAAMPLIDAAACAFAGAHEAALLCLALASLTVMLQRTIPGS